MNSAVAPLILPAFVSSALRFRCFLTDFDFVSGLFLLFRFLFLFVLSTFFVGGSSSSSPSVLGVSVCWITVDPGFVPGCLPTLCGIACRSLVKSLLALLITFVELGWWGSSAGSFLPSATASFSASLPLLFLHLLVCLSVSLILLVFSLGVVCSLPLPVLSLCRAAALLVLLCAHLCPSLAPGHRTSFFPSLGN